MQRTGATHAAHHLVEDQEDAVAVADLADALEVVWHSRSCAERCADHGLGNEGNDVLAAELIDLVLQLAGKSLAIRFRRLASAALAILIDRRDMMGLD
jgi:hypothetical protein